MMGNQLYESGPLDTNVFTEMPAGEWTLPDNVTPLPQTIHLPPWSDLMPSVEK